MAARTGNTRAGDTLAARTRNSAGTRATGDVIHALAQVGLRAHHPRRPSSDSGSDLVVKVPAGRTLILELKAFSAPTPADVAHLVRSKKLGPQTVGMVVADRVGRATRDELAGAGWGWLDRRGHLRLVRAPVFIDTVVDPLTPAVQADAPGPDPLSAQVGLEVALELLMTPAEPVAVRRLARQLGRSPSAVSKALAGLRRTGLVDREGLPLVPELFSEVAGVWRPSTYYVVQTPQPHDEASFDMATDDLSQPGWALTDTRAAELYGAPVVATAAYPPDLYVPSAQLARRAVGRYGQTETYDDRGGTIRVAPAPAVCQRRFRGRTWPLAHPVVVALDLARDRGRGTEILEDWTPAEKLGVARVW